MNKDMYFKMMGLKKEAAQPVPKVSGADQGTTPYVNAPAVNASTGGTPVVPKENVFGLGSKEQSTTGQQKAETPPSNARNILNNLK